ncbi:hypothetical protein, partial [Corallococcus carmarthensis]|uniref:hypothetical protein n=1 Tax=Corallococcus carmarthensis TaxID=2316728 RepID=UPI001C108FA5
HFPLAALFSAALEVKRPQKIDCGFPQSITAWACYLVFKDRAAYCDFVACRLLFNRRGCSFYFSSKSASTSLFRPAGCFEIRRRRPVTSAASFEGAASTSAPRSLSTARCQLSSPPAVRVLPAGLLSSVGRGFYLFAAFAVNPLVDCPISFSVLHSLRSSFRASARASK